VTNTLLTFLSALIWWVIYSSAAALIPALICWPVLRWLEKTSVVFNRTYLACLLWTLFGLGAGGLVLLSQRSSPAQGYAIFSSPWMRGVLVLDMLVGALLLWRLVPRIDARRIRPTSACMAVAIVTVLVLIAGTVLVGR
jgi:hypothetical protein